MKKSVYSLPLLAYIFFPVISQAQIYRLQSPLSDEISSLPLFISALLKIVTQIGIPVAAIFLVYSGFLFVTARGNEQQISKARSALVWTIVGTAVILGAWILSEAIAGTIEQLR